MEKVGSVEANFLELVQPFAMNVFEASKQNGNVCLQSFTYTVQMRVC